MHLLFLSKFSKPTDPENICNQPYWFDFLPEPPDKVVNRFIKEEMLEEKVYSVEERVMMFSVKDLKDILRGNGLKVSGRKQELIDRINEHDSSLLEASLPEFDHNNLTLAESGKEIVDSFQQKETAEYEAFLDELIALFQAKDTRNAYLLSKEFSEKRKLKEYNQTRPTLETINSPEIWLKTLDIILNCEKIGILHSIDNADFEKFRIAAGLSFLVGKKDLERYGIEDIETGLHFDNATASRMIMFYANRQFELLRAKGNDIKRVVFHSVGGCPICQELDGKTFNIDEAPEIPHKDCTGDKGCRCYYESIWEDLLS